MSKFKESFGKELGKNSAKFVSNKLFGKKWSTPNSLELTIKKEEAKTKQLQQEQEYEKFEYEKKKDLDAKLAAIQELVFTTDKNEITNIIGKVIATATAAFSKISYSNEDNEHQKAIIKSCIEKTEEGIYRLKSINENYDADFYQKRLDQFKAEMLNKEQGKKKTTRIIVYTLLSAVVLFFLLAYINKYRNETKLNEYLSAANTVKGATSVTVKPKTTIIKGDLGEYFEVVDKEYQINMDKESFNKTGKIMVELKRNGKDFAFNTHKLNPFGTNGSEDYHIGFGIEMLTDVGPALVIDATDYNYIPKECISIMKMKKGETGYLSWDVEQTKFDGLKTFQLTSSIEKSH
ncbi:MAG: hypothetical protein K8R85_09340 [Bacteroidetes bacterium]|nr:hypothetical protein [Bacteroidota bacterium]